jgi:uncharacterized protein YidB (DUF937 family)
VKTGPNSEIGGGELLEALGPDVLNELAAKTGLSHQEIVDRLSAICPKQWMTLRRTARSRIPKTQDEVLNSAGSATGAGPSSTIV